MINECIKHSIAIVRVTTKRGIGNVTSIGILEVTNINNDIHNNNVLVVL